MAKNILILFPLILINVNLFAQFNPSLKKSVIETFKQTAEQRVRNFYSDLDLIGDQDITNVERTYIITQILNSLFGDKQVYVFNDIDLTDRQPKIVESGTYLHNVKLYFGNSEVEFEIDSLILSDVYVADDFYFIKVEVQREMRVTLEKQLLKDVKNLDFYLRFVPDIIDCKLYSIKPHEDNAEEFKKVKIEDDSGLGSFILKSDPTGAAITIVELPEFKGETTYEFLDFKPDTYNINLNKTGFYPVTTSITIEANKKLEKIILLNPITDDSESVKLKRQFSRKQAIWLSGAGLTAIAGGYFKYSADKKYKDYLISTDSDEATELQKTIKLYDKLTMALTGVAAICAVEFTIQTIKKGKERKKYQAILNGSEIRFVANF